MRDVLVRTGGVLLSAAFRVPVHQLEGIFAGRQTSDKARLPFMESASGCVSKENQRQRCFSLVLGARRNRINQFYLIEKTAHDLQGAPHSGDGTPLILNGFRRVQAFALDAFVSFIRISDSSTDHPKTTGISAIP